MLPPKKTWIFNSLVPVTSSYVLYLIIIIITREIQLAISAACMGGFDSKNNTICRITWYVHQHGDGHAHENIMSQ